MLKNYPYIFYPEFGQHHPHWDFKAIYLWFVNSIVKVRMRNTGEGSNTDVWGGQWILTAEVFILRAFTCSLVFWLLLCQYIRPGSLVATVVLVIAMPPPSPTPSSILLSFSSSLFCYFSILLLNVVWIPEILQNEMPMWIIPNLSYNSESQHYFTLTSKNFIYSPESGFSSQMSFLSFHFLCYQYP